nr:MAG TPA_asm: hypothetical protein [Caudoviricetes sp.]
MDFLKLGEVSTVEEILDTDTVLVARDGQIYRADKSKVGGGAGGYLLEPADGEIVKASDSSGVFYITSQINDMLKAIEAGATVTIKMDGKHFEESMAGTVMRTCLIAAASGGPLETQLPGIALIGYAFAGGDFGAFYFTNGGPVPGASSTSTTSVNAISALASKLHDKPVVEVANGVD